MSPGVFFYYTKVVAPSSNFTIDIVQTNNNSNVPLFDIQQGDQIRLFTADCTVSNLGTISNGGGQAHITVNGATAGQLFIVSVKYSPNSIVGTKAPSPSTVHYDFATAVNGTVVDFDANGLDLKRK